MKAERWLLVLAATAGVLALATTGAILFDRLTERRTPSGPGLVATAANVGGPIALIDHRSRPVTEADFAGSLNLVYFGYSYCPDVCPTTLQIMMAALDRLGDAAARVRPIFVTVDPARDTPGQLATYVELFGPRLIGLTGSRGQVAAAAREFRVYYALRTDLDPKDYPVDHSSQIYLLDGDWRLLAVFRHDASVGEIAEGLRRFLAPAAAE